MSQEPFSAVELKIVYDIDEQQRCLRLIRRVMDAIIMGRSHF